MFAKFSTLYALEILNVMRDYNEIYLSIFSVFHEICCVRNGLLEMTIGFLHLGAPFKAGRTVRSKHLSITFEVQQLCSQYGSLVYSTTLLSPVFGWIEWDDF